MVVGLVRRGMWERARAIEGSLAEVVGMCEGCVPEVFGTGEVPASSAEAGEIGNKAVGGDAVLQESIEAAGKRKEPPVIRPFEKLSLLGT